MSRVAKEDEEFAIPTTIRVKYSDILSLIINAFDTAIGYWAYDAEPEYPEGFEIAKIPWVKKPEDWKNVRKFYFCPLVPGGKISFHDNVDNDKIVTMDLDSVKRGVQIMAEKYPRHFSDFLNENDDAITADVFIQCCVFGEARYG